MDKGKDTKGGEGATVEEKHGFFVRHAAIVFILIVFAFIVVFRLGENYFWAGEAETAGLARNILKYKLPKVYDGTNLIELVDKKTSNEDLVWIYRGWLPYYTAAASFYLLEESTFAGRLPFAIIGILAVLLLYRLVRLRTGDRTLAVISALILAVSAQYILYLRQCYGYALIAFATILTIHFYLNLKGFFSLCGLIIAGTLLFHSNYYAPLPLIGAAFVHSIIFERKLKKVALLLVACVFIAGLALAWMYYFKAYGIFTKPAAVTLSGYLANLQAQGFRISRRITPILFMLIGFIFFFPRKTHHKKELGYLWLAIIACAGLAALMPEADRFECLAVLLPIGAFFVALIYRNLSRISETLAASAPFLFVVFTIFTDADVAGATAIRYFRGEKDAYSKNEALQGHLWNCFFRKEYFDLVRDYASPFEGPNRGIATFLKEGAKEGDAVAVSFSHLSTMFYTNTKVLPRIHTKKELRDKQAKIPGLVVDPFTLEYFWFIPQRHHLRQFDKELLAKINSGGVKCEKYETQYFDTPSGWEPDLDRRLAGTKFEEEKLVIYKILNK